MTAAVPTLHQGGLYAVRHRVFLRRVCTWLFQEGVDEPDDGLPRSGRNLHAALRGVSRLRRKGQRPGSGQPEPEASVTDDALRTIIVKGGAAAGKSPLMPPNPDLDAKPEVVNGLVAKVRSFKK
jgi:hypothetical protein